MPRSALAPKLTPIVSGGCQETLTDNIKGNHCMCDARGRVPKLDRRRQCRTAHELLKAVYRSPLIPLAVRMRAAIAAIPFEVPKLAVTAQVSENDIATLLDQRIARYQQMKLLEVNGAKVIDAQSRPVETKPVPARTNDRRFRRF